jgi:hypothetical protein
LLLHPFNCSDYAGFTYRYLAISAITKPSASMHLYELPSLFRQPLLLRLPALTIMQRKKQRPSSLYFYIFSS